MFRMLIPFLLLLPCALIGCASSSTGSAGLVELKGTPISMNPPRGFVLEAEDERTIYPSRPFRYFHLPELPNGGTPAYPEISIEQVLANEAPNTLDAYIKKVIEPIDNSISISPRDVSIDGHHAVEFAKSYTVIADFTNGGSAEGGLIHHEIAFQDNGIIYRCVMEAAPEDKKNYIKIFEEFCASVRFTKRD